MYQISGKASAKTTIIVLLATVVAVALSYLAMQVFVGPASENVQLSVEVPQTARVFVDASIMRERWIERHLNPLFDAPSDPQIVADIQAANAMRAHWTERHMNPAFDQGAVAENGVAGATADTMTLHWIERHMNPIFDR